MANLKISELAAADTLTGAELIPVVQSGVNAKVTVTQAIADMGLATKSGEEDLENKTLKNATENNGSLTGTTPAIVPGVWTWTLSGASTPTDGLANGQSCTLVITAGAYSITWPTSTVVGTWPSGLDVGVNVIVFFKAGGVLYRSYGGAA